MTDPLVSTDPLVEERVASRAGELFAASRIENYARVDRIFIVVMALQWLFGIALALGLSPYSYEGASRSVHLHVYLAVFLGAAITAMPVGLAVFRPGRTETRYVIAVSQMLWSALLIHLSGGRIETHFHVFGSLALLAFYRDYRPLVPATIVVVADHFLRGLVAPESVYGISSPEWWRFLEHAGWVVFENTFLTWSCIHGEKEMRDIADRQARVETLNDQMMVELVERERAQKEIAHLTEERSLILDNAADGIMGLDLESRPTFMNASASKMTGWFVNDLNEETHSAHDLLHRDGAGGGECAGDACPVMRAIPHGQSFHASEEWLRHRDGRLVPVQIRTAPMLARDGAHIGAVVTFRDMTDRREIDRIRVLDRMKDEFVSTVSHELRTPLTAIRGALGLLAGGRVGTLPEKGMRLLDIAVANTDRLVKLINDILDIERMESGVLTLTKRTCHADALAREAVALVRPLLHRDGIHVEINAVGDSMIADPDRVLQTLTNLLGNAVKFSPAASTIRVEAKRRRDEIVFSVTDEGRGIPADRLEAIFERFQQVDASDARVKGGSGLGLAICRSIVTQHGGEIWVESVLGQGSCFSFTIPAPLPETAPQPKPAPVRVLLCNNGRGDERGLLAQSLTGAGYDVRTVTDSHSLMKAIGEGVPDAVVLDLLSPGVNAWDALAAIKRDRATSDIPVVILSVLTPDEANGSNSGVCEWLQKPLEGTALREALERAFDLKNRTPRLMLIEDDHDLANMIKVSFEDRGMEIVHAATGNEAIQMAPHCQPDLVVLDLMLPDISGNAGVDWLKRHDVWQGVPLVVYSAFETSEAEQERLRLGKAEFMTKSTVSPDEFEGRVMTLLGSIASRGPEVLNAVA